MNHKVNRKAGPFVPEASLPQISRGCYGRRQRETRCKGFQLSPSRATDAKGRLIRHIPGGPSMHMPLPGSSLPSQTLQGNMLPYREEWAIMCPPGKKVDL